MSTTPFRTAFWALGLALAMTLLLGIPSPQRIKLAMHSKKDAQKQPFFHVLADIFKPRKASGTLKAAPTAIAQAAPVAKPAAAPVEPAPVKSTPAPTAPVIARQEAPEMPAPAVAPVRIAAANPSFPLGMPESNSTSMSSQPEAPLPIQQTPRNIPVPEPMRVRESVNASTQTELVELKQELLRLQVAMLQRDLKESQKAPPMPESVAVKAPVKAEEPQSLTVAEPSISQASRVTPAIPGVIAIPGTDPQRKTFRFNDVPLATVFKTLGEEAGWQVVVSADVSGNYSGEFVNADPAQAFAVVLRANNLTHNRRGNYFLISPRKFGR